MTNCFGSTITIKCYLIKYFIIIIFCHFAFIPVNPDPHTYIMLLVWLPLSIVEAGIDSNIVIWLYGFHCNLRLYLILTIFWGQLLLYFHDTWIFFIIYVIGIIVQHFQFDNEIVVVISFLMINSKRMLFCDFIPKVVEYHLNPIQWWRLLHSTLCKDFNWICYTLTICWWIQKFVAMIMLIKRTNIKSLDSSIRS